MRRLLMLWIGLAFLLPATMEAQLTTGSITGTVSDSEGNPLPGVTLTLKCDCNRSCPLDCSCCPAAAPSVVSGSDGGYSFHFLRPAYYVIEAALSGFGTTKAEVTVNVGASVKHDIVIGSASASESIPVSNHAVGAAATRVAAMRGGVSVVQTAGSERPERSSKLSSAVVEGFVYTPKGMPARASVIFSDAGCRCDTDCPEKKDCSCCPAATTPPPGASGAYRVRLAPGTYNVHVVTAQGVKFDRTVTVAAGAKTKANVRMEKQ